VSAAAALAASALAGWLADGGFAAALFVVGGSILLTLGFAFHRRERRHAAILAELRASQRVLRTQSLQFAELARRYAEQKRRVEQANEVKTKFLAEMSHELRTPLNAIIGFSEIMERRLFGPLGADRYDEYCRDIRMSGQHLLGVIDEILETSNSGAARVMSRET
jgi:two-component system cell cycle sensor histidine kinase PleC